MILGFDGLVGRAARPPAEAALVDYYVVGKSGSPGEVTIGLGAEDPGRHIVVASTQIGNTQTPELLVGGNAPTLLRGQVPEAGVPACFLHIIHIPTGSTALLQLNYDGEPALGAIVGIARLVRLRSATPTAVAGTHAVNADSASTSIAVQKRGLVIAAVAVRRNAATPPSPTWTGLTKRGERIVQDNDTFGQGGYALSMAWNTDLAAGTVNMSVTPGANVTRTTIAAAALR